MFNEDSKKIVFEKIINERCPFIEDVDKELY